MAWSSGTFSRTNGANTGSTTWADDESDGVGIQSDRHDVHDQDIATGINTCLTKDGQNTPTANLPMGGFRHTNVGDASARTQYAKVSQIQDQSYIWGGTSSGSANAQTLTLSPAITAYASGLTVRFRAGFTNTGSLTMNVNGVGAATVFKGGGQAIVAGDVIAGNEYEFTYNTTLTGFIISGKSDARLMGHDTSGITLNNTSSETSLLATGCTVKANQLATGRMARVTAWGLLTNSTGGNVTFTWRVKLGGQTVVQKAFTASPDSYDWYATYTIMGTGAATQKVVAWIAIEPEVNLVDRTTGGTSDSTTDLTLALTGQMSSASASASFQQDGCFVEYL